MVTAPLTPVGVGIHDVLIATDFSRYSDAALQFGLELANGYGAKAYVASVVPANEFLLAGPEAYVAAKDATRRDLLQLKEELKRTHSYIDGKDYYLYLLEGDVAPALLDFSRQHGVDLLVVATHGRKGLGKVLMGSVAEHIFRQSPVPVLTIGPRVRLAKPPAALQNIFVPVAFTPASEQAIGYAAALARERNASLTALHVVDPAALKAVPDHACVMQGIKARLAELMAREAKGIRCCLRVETGRVQTLILRVAGEIATDLVVMGVRPWNGILDHLMWPQAYEVVRESVCPVITVRGTEGE
jgi:nucleotide-binding universal stress UspA family protein